MIYRRSNQWVLYPYKVKYIQNNEEFEQWALPNKDWWIDFADKWEHTSIVEFIDVELSSEQLERYYEIQFMPEDFHNEYINYIETGVVLNNIPENHPLRLLKLKQENRQQGVELSEREIREILQGREISDLEIRLLAGGL